MRTPAMLLLATLAQTIFPASASATSMHHLDTRALTLGASEIVVGTVASTQSRWSADRKKIFTDVAIDVSESLKGSSPATTEPHQARITLTQLGGEIDGIRYSIPGGPLFHRGEEALVFVWRDASGRAQVNGLAQGKFEITRDAKGVATVQRSSRGLAIRDVRRLSAVRATEPAPLITLDELKLEIRRVLATPEVGR